MRCNNAVVTNIMNVRVPSLVKCIKNTPAYFAERLHKAMQVQASF